MLNIGSNVLEKMLPDNLPEFVAAGDCYRQQLALHTSVFRPTEMLHEFVLYTELLLTLTIVCNHISYCVVCKQK